MRTEYRVLHRPRHDDQAADTVGQYPTLADAAEATGYPFPEDWRTSEHHPDIRLLVDEVRTPGREQEWMIVDTPTAETDAERVDLAIKTALGYARYDGDHHKMWVIDEMVRILAGDRYAEVVADRDWDEGIAP